MFHLIETHFRCVFFSELTILVWLTTSIKIHSIDDDEWIFNVNHAQRSVLTLVYPTWACVCVRARPPVCVCACSLFYTYIRGAYACIVSRRLIHIWYIHFILCTQTYTAPSCRTTTTALVHCLWLIRIEQLFALAVFNSVLFRIWCLMHTKRPATDFVILPVNKENYMRNELF